jgi:hypothetical protein
MNKQDSTSIGISQSGLDTGKRIELPTGKLAKNIITEKIPEHSIVVPELINYPDLRKAFDSGTFSTGDVITVSVSVVDADGNDKTPEDSDYVLTLDNYTSDETKEVLGILYFNFIESIKPNIEISQPLPPIEIDPNQKIK